VIVPELRLDANSARIRRLEMSAGAVVPIGIYVRLALTAGGGVARENVMTHATARGDAIARFELDPLKQHTRGAYVGGGISLLGRDGPHVNAYLALVAGLELKARGAEYRSRARRRRAFRDRAEARDGAVAVTEAVSGKR